MDFLVEFYMMKDVIYMSEKSGFEKIKKQLEAQLKGVQIQATKSIFDDLMVAVYEADGNKKVNVELKTIQKYLGEKAVDVVTDIDREKDQLKFAESASKEDTEKAKWLYDWAKKYVEQSVEACAKVTGKDDREKAAKKAEVLVKIFGEYTKEPWYAAISPYWRNFKKYFGNKKEIEKAQAANNK